MLHKKGKYLTLFSFYGQIMVYQKYGNDFFRFKCIDCSKSHLLVLWQGYEMCLLLRGAKEEEEEEEQG